MASRGRVLPSPWAQALRARALALWVLAGLWRGWPLRPRGARADLAAPIQCWPRGGRGYWYQPRLGRAALAPGAVRRAPRSSGQIAPPRGAARAPALVPWVVRPRWAGWPVAQGRAWRQAGWRLAGWRPCHLPPARHQGWADRPARPFLAPYLLLYLLPYLLRHLQAQLLRHPCQHP